MENFKNLSDLSRAYSDATILMHEAIAKKVGLSGTDHKYLGLILKNGKVNAGDIAKLTGLTTGAVTGLLDRLEKKKLIKRTFSKTDRRMILIVPNEKAISTLLAPIFSSLQHKTHQLLSTFSEVELNAIEKYFSQASSLMQQFTKQLNDTSWKI